MKILILLISALILASCGKVDVSQSGVGQVRSSQPQAISTDDLIVFDRICEGLTRKGLLYSGSIPAPVTFTLGRQDCDGVESGPVDQTVIVESNGGNFQYRVQSSNAAFVFPNVETASFGIMQPFCGGTNSLPIVKTNGEAIWITRSVSQVDCPTLSNEECVGIETGSPSGAGEYRIHTRELVRFNVLRTSPRYGLFTYRKALSNIGCTDKKLSSSVSAILK